MPNRLVNPIVRGNGLEFCRLRTFGANVVEDQPADDGTDSSADCSHAKNSVRIIAQKLERLKLTMRRACDRLDALTKTTTTATRTAVPTYYHRTKNPRAGW